MAAKKNTPKPVERFAIVCVSSIEDMDGNCGEPLHLTVRPLVMRSANRITHDQAGPAIQKWLENHMDQEDWGAQQFAQVEFLDAYKYRPTIIGADLEDLEMSTA